MTWTIRKVDRKTDRQAVSAIDTSLRYGAAPVPASLRVLPPEAGQWPAAGPGPAAERGHRGAARPSAAAHLGRATARPAARLARCGAGGWAGSRSAGIRKW